ncbi:MAG: hypothetical protein ABI855_01945 [Bacteroidota bacterium]
MKKIILSFSTALIVTISQAQINKKDTVMLDTTQVEKINKMPMDSTHYKMPVAPLTPKDSMYRKTGDDEDPKRSDPPK